MANLNNEINRATQVTGACQEKIEALLPDLISSNNITVSSVKEMKAVVTLKKEYGFTKGVNLPRNLDSKTWVSIIKGILALQVSTEKQIGL
ncbi:conserved hypothetical protein [Ricinus communis]|uniref:Uncharacterized protein n=1 Tax=Ricinus communis TaxID=3988 RepID=B9RAP2_RICCO|nr:conserved hypothetical protein [Ricinus communis]